jgi:hypothetical protein
MARSVVRQRGEKEGRAGGGSGRGVPRGAGGGRGAWPRPTGGAPNLSRPAVTRAWRTRATRCYSDKGVLGADGPAREENGVAEPR